MMGMREAGTGVLVTVGVTEGVGVSVAVGREVAVGRAVGVSEAASVPVASGGGGEISVSVGAVQPASSAINTNA